MSWNSSGGVYGRICQRPSGHLSPFVDDICEGIRAAERAQILEHSMLPDKGATLLGNAETEAKGVGYCIRSTSDNLFAVIDTPRSTFISA